VALPAPDGEPVWYGGAKLDADLSLPRLQAGWSAGAAPTDGRAGRVDPADRPALWREATDAASAAAADVRHPARTDPGAARAAADLLHVAARVTEPTGRGLPRCRPGLRPGQPRAARPQPPIRSRRRSTPTRRRVARAGRPSGT